MLSKIDIENEIGKQINIIPFNNENIKEASLNVTASKYAWTYDHENSVTAVNNEEIILKPHKTTLVYTEEIIGIGSKIGGTVHSKVSMAVKGIGHIGTTFGPCYCGRLIIPLHNITNQDISIKIGETFATLIFHYVQSKGIKINDTDSGHGNRLGEWNIHTDETDIINPGWSKDIKKIREQLKIDNNYINFNNKKNRYIKLSQRVFITLIPILIILFIQLVIKPQNFDIYHYLIMYFISIPNMMFYFIK